MEVARRHHASPAVGAGCRDAADDQLVDEDKIAVLRQLILIDVPLDSFRNFPEPIFSHEAPLLTIRNQLHAWLKVQVSLISACLIQQPNTNPGR